MIKRIVVTGASGFIGSQLALALVAAGHKDLLLVDSSLGSVRPNHALLPPGIRMDQNEFIRMLELDTIKPDMIFHMGACSDTTEKDWGFLYQNNLQYSQRIYMWAARWKKRLIYASSAATYGDGSQGFDDCKTLARLKPLNLYGRSKHEFDLWVAGQTHTPKQCVGLKFFNVFGPGEAHKGRMASMAFHGLQQVRETGRMKLFKHGEQARDFVYIRDVVAIMLKLMQKPSVSGLFNVGTGKARTFADLAGAIFKALHLPPQIDFIDMPSDLALQYQSFTEAKMRKLAAAGIKHKFMSLEDAVFDYAMLTKG